MPLWNTAVRLSSRDGAAAQIKKRLVVAQPSYVVKVADKDGTRVVSTVGGSGGVPAAA